MPLRRVRFCWTAHTCCMKIDRGTGCVGGSGVRGGGGGGGGFPVAQEFHVKGIVVVARMYFVLVHNRKCMC